MNRRKCLRKIHKTLNIMCRGDNRNRLNVRSIVVDGLPIKSIGMIKCIIMK